MSLYGSSPFNISGYTFFSSNGPKGAPGEQGPQGFKGNPGFGPDGPTGHGITFLTFINNRINTIYTDGSVRSSDVIDEITGNYLLEITAVTGGNFSPLASIDQLTDQSFVYNEDGDSKTFEFIRRLNFKNIKTNSSPFIKLEYKGPPDAPHENEPGQTIKMTYSVFNLGASNVSGGPDGSLVINNPGNIQSGFTGTTYNSSEDAAGFGILNGAEQLVVVAPLNFESNKIQVWPIDPSIGSVFYLKDYVNITATVLGKIHGHHIMVKTDATSNSSKAFTLILPPQFFVANDTSRLFYSTYNNISDIITSNFTASNFKFTFSPNVIWQNNSHFCPSQKYDVVNFISLGSRYIGIPAIFNTNLNTEAVRSTVPSFTCKPSNLESFYRIERESRYGLCCMSDCTCELMNDFECSGYFYEGVTCGGPTGPCSTSGACCLYSTDQNIVVPCQELTYCQCATIASESGYSFNWNPFTTIKKTCSDFNCANARDGLGACCDGNGGCTELTSEQCSAVSGYFQGVAVNCTTSEKLNVCYDGLGSCCDSGVTCSNGITGSTCLSEFKTYFGDGTTCNQFICSAADIPCYSIIEGNILSSGMEYEDGVIVGIFNPNSSKAFGARIFDGTITNYDILTGTTYDTPAEYNTVYDYSGYGFDPSSICESDSDSYMLIVSKHPVNIDSTKHVVDGNALTHEFIWSTGAVAWGPLVDTASFTINEFDVNNLHYKEGYLYDSSIESSSKLSLYENSFLSCSAARFDTDASTFIENRPVQSFNGAWTRNNGLYNTIRLSSAEYFYYNIGTSSNGATMENYAPVSSDITAARALSIYNRDIPRQDTLASQWYIPSIDEMAYIANHCRNVSEFNLNARLVELGYTPLSGWHWTSTGSIDASQEEGILTPSGITHGSVAWAMNVDVDGIDANMQISKKARTNQYQVRPIKLIRCDKRYYSNTDINNRLWNIPLLSETIIDNQ